MKIREISLQNGIFVYKVGLSFTKWDFHLQSGTLALQTGLLLYISPTFFSTFYYIQIFAKINFYMWVFLTLVYLAFQI